jgi:hypothetical protein
LSGSDGDGVSDIRSYRLNIDGRDTSSAAPFDFVKTFSTVGSHKVYGTVVDSHGASDESGTVSVVVGDKPPVTYSAPVASLSLSNTVGNSPMTVRMQVTGTDKDNDISSYRLYLDGIVDSSLVPIDTSFTFYPGTHSVFAEVVDKHKLSNKTSSRMISIDKTFDGWVNQFPFPNGKVNLFVYPDSTAIYNGLKTKKDRDDFLEMARANDITPTIPTGIHTVGGVEYGWACAQASRLFSTNSMVLGNNPYVLDAKFYDWYNGGNFDSIYIHRGTLKYINTHKAPIFTADVSPSHQMNYGVPGNGLRNGKSLDLIEMMYTVSRSNVQPNDGGVFL